MKSRVNKLNWQARQFLQLFFFIIKQPSLLDSTKLGNERQKMFARLSLLLCQCQWLVSTWHAYVGKWQCKPVPSIFHFNHESVFYSSCCDNHITALRLLYIASSMPDNSIVVGSLPVPFRHMEKFNKRTLPLVYRLWDETRVSSSNPIAAY